jgi:hypothetical protein
VVSVVAQAVLTLLLGGSALVLARSSEAQEPAEPPAAEAEEVQDPDETASTGDEEEPSFRWTRVRLNGRFVGWWRSVSQDGVSKSDADVDNARLTLHWRPARWLRGQVEYDVAMDRKLKDAFLTMRTDLVSFRGGQFKPPFSVVAMDSRWDLPVAERGQLDFVLRDSLGVIGRRPGFQVGYQPRGGDTRAFLGVFRASSVRGDRIGDGAFNDLADDWVPKLTGRVQHERRRLRLGLSGDYRPAEPLPGEGYQRFWTVGADVAWRQRQKQGGWRLWGEGFVGSSWQDSNPFDGVNATFVAGQVIGAWRYGGRKDHAFYLEPYTLLSVLDPDTNVREDLLWEAAGGVNVGRWDQVRITVEVQRRSAGANTPPSLGFVFDSEPPFSRTGLVLQIGGVF